MEAKSQVNIEEAPLSIMCIRGASLLIPGLIYRVRGVQSKFTYEAFWLFWGFLDQSVWQVAALLLDASAPSLDRSQNSHPSDAAAIQDSKVYSQVSFSITSRGDTLTSSKLIGFGVGAKGSPYV